MRRTGSAAHGAAQGGVRTITGVAVCWLILLFVAGCGHKQPTRPPGKSWTRLATIRSVSPVDIQVHAGQILISGEITSVDGMMNDAPILRFDGTGWRPFGGDFHGGHVYSLLPYQGALLASGDFAQIGDLVTHGVARFDGQAWHPMPIESGNAELRLDSALGRPVAYAGTAYSTQVLATWDEFWREFPALPGIAYPSAVGEFGSDVVVAYVWGGTEHTGDPYVARLRGLEWTPMGRTPPSRSGSIGPRPALTPAIMSHPIRDMIVYKGVLYACGDVSPQDDSPVPISRWSDGIWTQTGRSLLGRGAAMALYDGMLLLGGNFRSEDGRVRDLARWDGSSWTQFPIPDWLQEIVTITVSGEDILVVGGGSVAMWH